jgi:hypothetical protein
VARLALALTTSKLRPTATRAPLGHAVGLRRLPALTWNICASISVSGSRTPGCGRDCATSVADAINATLAAISNLKSEICNLNFFMRLAHHGS